MADSTQIMRVLRFSDLDPQGREALYERGSEVISDGPLKDSIAKLIEDVRENGDEAVVRALKEFDGCDVAEDGLRVTEAEFDSAETAVPADVRGAIAVGIRNLREFNERLTADRSWRMEISPGLVAGENQTPIASAGLFVPSGKGSFPSVLMQLGTPATVAGVPEIAVVVPPIPGRGGEVDPAVLCVARELGRDHLHQHCRL